jgi:two-component system chemotaxis sensor kinase CheA
MVDIDHIQESLRRLETVNPSSLDELNAMRVDLRQAFQLLGTESLEQTLSGVLESLPSLAAQLGKPAPVVRVHDDHTRLRSDAIKPLRNVFMHLLRNSLDHGIEAAQERSAKHKAPSGVIEIAVRLTPASLEIALSDDGRGLALARIRRTAIEKAWIAEDQLVSDDEIAQFIFRAGFSTAREVTDVSGRGVGMDAVRGFLERENGRIELHFTDAHVGADYRQFRTVVFLPAHVAVQAGERAESGPLVATA